MVPLPVVEAFEAEGFIWGGKWYHYDTMHFEYRPELMTLDKAKSALPKIGSGMDKKVLACIEAIEMGVKEAIIASGQVENPLSAAVAHRDCTVIGHIE